MSSTRLAALDVRSGARLVLGRTLLSRGRTSGLFISESAAVSLGVGCAIVGMRIAAVEIETNAQVVCESKMIAQRILRVLEGATGAKDIDDEVSRIIDEGMERARTILKEHKVALEAISKKLLEVETLERPEYEALLKLHGVEIKDAFEEMYKEDKEVGDPTRGLEIGPESHTEK